MSIFVHRDDKISYNEKNVPYPPPPPSKMNVPITGILGDQQAALVGQQCLTPGLLKNTYGTGCFLLQNTGTQKIYSNSGLLTTVGYQKSDGTIIYALEGSIAIAGLLTKWLQEQLGLVKNVQELNEFANQVDNSGGVHIVPAFGGLFCPYWDASARGIICGLTQYSNKNHICRAALEAVAWQVKDVIEAMKNDGQECKVLKADGGMTNSKLLMQIQADILNIPVVTPEMKESTALGAAAAAGCFIGEWEAKGWENFKSSKSSSKSSSERNSEESRDSRESDDRSISKDSSDVDSAYQEEDQLKFYVTKPREGQNEYDYSKWKKAVEKSQNWA